MPAKGFADSLVGMEVEAARTKAEANGFKLRVRIRDGKPLTGTCDYCEDRINVSVQDGKVTGITGMG